MDIKQVNVGNLIEKINFLVIIVLVMHTYIRLSSIGEDKRRILTSASSEKKLGT